MRKKIGLLSCFIFSVVYLWSQSPYHLNQKLTVANLYGTALYAKPSLDSEVKTKCYFGTEVLVVDRKPGKYPVTKEILPGLEWEGHWIHVIANQDTGYLIDLDLTPLPAFNTQLQGTGLSLVQQAYPGASIVEKDIQSPSGEGIQVNIEFEQGISYLQQSIDHCSLERYYLLQSSLSAGMHWMMLVYSNYFEPGATYLEMPKYHRTENRVYYFLRKMGDQVQEIQLVRKGEGVEISTHSCSGNENNTVHK